MTELALGRHLANAPGATEPRGDEAPTAPPVHPFRSPWLLASLALGTASLLVVWLAPTTRTALPWVVPAIDLVAFVCFGLASVLGCMDAVLRRHSRSIPMAAAACGAAIVWLPHLLSSPGVLPQGVGDVDAQTASALASLAHLATPTGLTLALVIRTRALVHGGRQVAVAMITAATATLWLILATTIAAPHLPAWSADGQVTTFGRTMAYLALVPIAAAFALHQRGHRGDERVACALLASLLLLAFQAVGAAVADVPDTPGWYAVSLLRLSPAVLLLVGQLQLYSRTVTRGLADQEALQASEAARRASLEGLQEGVALSDLTGLVHMLNDAGRRLLGYDAQELTELFRSGQWVSYREDGSVMPPAERPMRITMDTGKPVHGAIVGWRTRDGRFRVLRVSTQPVTDDAGAVTRIVTAFSDVADERAEQRRREKAEAERQRALEDLARANGELARSNADLEEFAAVAAHDLRTPLSTIGGFAELLRQGVAGPIGPANEEYAEHIQVSVRRLQALVEDLLTYARVGQGTRRARVEVAALAQEAIDALRLDVDTSGADIVVGPMPVVDADPAQVRQLLQNLLGNALKFHAPDIAPVVRVAAEERPDGWVFAVCDNGIGVDPRFRDRVFKMFQRLHASGQYAGTGIGLAVCRRVVENHGGAIWIDAADGGGTVVRFTLEPPRAS